MIGRLRKILTEHWCELGLSAEPKAEQVRWLVINGGITVRSKLVCFVWVEGGLPGFVVKFPRFREYNECLAAEYRTLQKVQQYVPRVPRSQPMVPRPLMVTEADGLLVTFESSLEGILLRSYLREHPHRVLTVLGKLDPFVTWLASMHLQSARPMSLDKMFTLVLEPLTRASEIVSGVTPLEARTLDRLCTYARILAEREILLTVFNHHDLGTTNLLVGRQGNFAGLIDWESGALDLPLMDLIYFMARFAYDTRGSGPGADQLRGFREFFFGERSTSAAALPSFVARGWLAGYCEMLGLSVKWMPVLFAHTWLLHARNEHRRILELRDEGYILHGKPAVSEALDVSQDAAQKGHFRSQLRYYLENMEQSLPVMMAGGLTT
ncbi:MAG: aminoglycoside phosphotransferase family protein [Chloroflexia bacterium]